MGSGAPDRAERGAAVVVSTITEGFGSCQGKAPKPLPSHDYSKVGYQGGSPPPQKAATKTYAAGTFTIKSQIILKDGDVLRGAGRDQTTLYFPDGLKQMGVLCRDGTTNNKDCFDWPASKTISGLYMGVIGLQGASIGVEDLTIEFPANHAWKHYAGYSGNSGYNGFELKECTNCWIKDVAITNADNGIIVNGGKNNTLAGVHVSARPGGGHLHIAYSSGTQNNIAINFKVYGTSSHGLTMNWATVNNVYANGWGESIRIEPDHNCNGTGGAASCCKHMLYSNIAGKISSIQTKDRAGNPIPSTLWNVGSVDRCPLDVYTAQCGVSPPPQTDAGSGCTTAGQCDDGDPCTADTCSGGKCQHSAISGCCTASSQCDDSNVCTTDKCSGNKCQHGPVSGCCAFDSDCDDGNPCTTDSCDGTSGNCSNMVVYGCCAFDTDCDDGDPCTLDRCDPSTHACQHAPICGDAGVDVDSTVAADSGVGPDPGGDMSTAEGAGASALEPATDLVGGCTVGVVVVPPWAPILLIGLLFRPRRKSTR